MMLTCGACKKIFENGKLGNMCDTCTGEYLVPHVQEYEMIVEGLDDRGGPSGSFLQVTEAAVVDSQGRLVGRFTRADDALRAMSPGNHILSMITFGQPRSNVVGRLVCEGYYQAGGDD